MKRPKVVLLDVGGVLLLPAADRIATHLTGWGARPSGHDDALVHYEAVAAFDRSGDMRDYRRRYAEMVGVPTSASDRAARSAAFRGPWRRVVPGAREALHRLALEFLLAVVSDSDGSVSDQLKHAGVAQVGQGIGVQLRTVCDSAHLGVEKPHRKMFQTALDTLGAMPHEAVMIGDSLHCDVGGAQNLGIRPIHVSPYGCSVSGHDDVADVAAAVALLTEPAHAQQNE